MNINKNNKFISYVVNKSLLNDQHSDTTITLSKKTSITNPIPELISYIREKHSEDVSKEIEEYVSKIENKED